MSLKSVSHTFPSSNSLGLLFYQYQNNLAVANGDFTDFSGRRI